MLARTRGRRFAICVLAVAALTGTAHPVAAAPVVATAEQQLRWVVDASGRVPVDAAEQRQHLSTRFLDVVGGPDGFNAALRNTGRLTLRQVLDNNTPAKVEAIADGPARPFLVNLTVNAAGLVDFLFFGPYAQAPGSWSELDTRLRALAPRVSFVASVIDERRGCRPAHQIDADTAHPLGSAFKLYVLGALGQAVADHRADWDQQVAIRDPWKSLPSGILQNEPAGTRLPLRQYANYMVSISDNTATDHLIHVLGRDAVHRQLSRFDNRTAATNTPFLTTREFFALKGFRYPTLADSYLALPRPLRPTLLPALNHVPLTAITPWTEPRKIDQIEWFGSPNDICRAYTGLWRQSSRPALAPIGTSLSIEDGNIALDRTRYPTVWFKGGSEPGLLVLTYLARTHAGRLLMTSVMLSDPANPLDQAAIGAEAFALARGAIQLADQSSAR